MRTSTLNVCALLALSVAARAVAQAPTAPAYGPTAISAPRQYDHVPLFPTRQNLFEIPFQIDASNPGQEPVEVQLHVSANRGAAWTLQAKVSPQDGRFSFRAPHDGEYWFLVRTLNRAGKLLPDKPFEPELRVMVDTEPPAVEFRVSRGAAGEIVCHWKAADSGLKMETLQLSYQGFDAGSVWQNVAAPASKPGTDGSWTGTATFVAAGAKPPIFVRLEVGDAAGNTAVVQRQVERLPGEASPNPTALPTTSTNDVLGVARNPAGSPSGASPDTSPVSRSSARPWPAETIGPATEVVGPPPSPDYSAGETAPPNMARTFPGRETLPPFAAPPGEPFPSNVPRNIESVPPGRTGIAAAPASTPNAWTGPAGVGAPGPSSGGASETISPGDVESLPPPDEAASGNAPPNTGASLAVDNPLGNPGPQFLPDPSAAGAAASPVERNPVAATPPYAAEFSPPGVQPRLVNSRRFELDYDVESVGPSGVAKVELWTTRDGGATWRHSGNDPDSTSPYSVEVDAEGTYGFRMVIETTTGLRSPTPQPGDLPEVWVGVDVTKPVGRITAANLGDGEHAGELIIAWEASDPALVSRPIALSYAEAAGGPWTLIASGLPNDGRYSWRIDSRTPANVYLKLDMRDAAGNFGVFVTPQPVTIERVRPQGRIRGVRPIGQSARLHLPAEVSAR